MQPPFLLCLTNELNCDTGLLRGKALGSESAQRHASHRAVSKWRRSAGKLSFLPISPICHAPFLPYISPNTYVRRHLLFRQERRVGGRPSDARCRAALSFGGLIECDQVSFSLTHAPFFPICHTSHSSHISPRFVFFCVFLSPGPFFPDGTHPFFSISHRDLFV